MKALLTLVLFCSLVDPVPAGSAETLRISAAASMTDVVTKLISEFKSKHPHIDIIPTYSSSGALAKQIAMGAPADIYVSANPKWMAYLDREQQIVHATIQTLATNKLVFIAASGMAIDSLADLFSLRRIAIGSPSYVPAGSYTKTALESAGSYHRLEVRKKLVLAKDARQALLYADRGEVDGAFVYLTDARLARHASIRFIVPEALYPEISYPVAITSSGKDRPGSRDFYNFMLGDQSAAVLASYGFGTGARSVRQ